MSKRKFKEGDHIFVIKGIHKGMRGTISGTFGGGNRVRYRVTFKSFITYMYSYEMELDAERTILEKAKEETQPMLAKINQGVVEEVFKEESKLKRGMHVMLSKRGLAKIHMDGIIYSGHSYEWVCDNNYHTIDRVKTVDGINFYALVGFAKYYYFTDDDLIQIHTGRDVGDMVQFTRETLVKLGVELSRYYKDDTINKLPQDIIGPRKVLGICYKDDKVLYQLDGASFGKFFYEHEIEPYK